MLTKIVELLVRIIYFRRFRHGALIGKAVELANCGDFDEAICRLDALQPKLDPSLRPIYGLAKGRISTAANRIADAATAYLFALEADPNYFRAALELATIEGRQFRFEDARSRLERITAASTAPDDIKKEASGVLSVLDDIQNGEREKSYIQRAREMANRPLGLDNRRAGIPADLHYLDKWIEQEPERARELADDLALLIGESEAAMRSGRWNVTVTIENSLIAFADGTSLNPFSVVEKRLSNRDTTFKSLIEQNRHESSTH